MAVRRLISIAGLSFCAALISSYANAAQMFYFSDPSDGVFVDLSLDIVSGNAVGGTGTITDPAFWSGADTLTLVDLSTPGVNNLGGGNLSYRFGGGTDLIGDTTVPIDGNGLVFIVTNPSNPGLDLGFNIWSNGGNSYTGFLAGNAPPGSAYNVYNGYTVNSAAVPEPVTWALMLFGFFGLGTAMRMNRRSGIVMAPN
jgi:hypothetical protein